MAATDSGFNEYLPLVRPLDEEQARLVEILVAARGSEVSFEELRSRGIENPAVLAYELEIAGLPISHVQGRRAGGRASAVGLRLDATLPLEVPPQESSRKREPPQDGSAAGADAAGNGGARRRTAAAPRPPRELASWIATGVAALVLIIIVVALASGSGSGSGKGRHVVSALAGSAAVHSGQPASASVPAASAPAKPAHKSSHHTHPATPVAPPPPLSHAAQLQQAGHVLLAEGRYSAAIPELRAAISAGGESAANCSEPTTPGCVAYAEALYDLGRALRLDNANAAAGAVLRERLRIDSQRSAVQHEIGLNHRPHTSAPASRPPAHAKTPHATPSPAPTSTPKRTPSPAPTAHPITGGAAAPAP